MTFERIFEKTKYAFDHDEVYELLIGKGGYMYKAPMYPVAIPTCDEFIFSQGIYPLYRQSSPEAQKVIEDKLIMALRAMMRADDPVDVWWALALLYGQKLSEAQFKDSPFFIADSLLKEIAPYLRVKQKKLMQAHVYMCTQLKDGLWEDVLRYDMLLDQKFGMKLLEG